MAHIAPGITKAADIVESGIDETLNYHIGEKYVSRFHWFSKREDNKGEYAGKDEFVSAFESKKTTLYRLALSLTTKPKEAERCLILALRECISSSSVSKDWAYKWSRRVVIRTAIRLVMDSNALSSAEASAEAGTALTALSTEDLPDPTVTFQAILALPDFDRFVFVICILERYSVHECALLLDKSPKDVNDAKKRTANELAWLDQFTPHEHEVPETSLCAERALAHHHLQSITPAIQVFLAGIGPFSQTKGVEQGPYYRNM